jgi:hypothetical protein
MRSCLGARRQRDAGLEDPFVALHQLFAAAPDAICRDRRDHLGHIALDALLPGRHRDRHPVVAVPDEMQVTDPVHVDRRDRLAAALS